MDTQHLEHVVLNALRLAARTFAANAKDPHLMTLRDQFSKDAADALRAAELIDVGELVITEKRSSLESDAASPRNSPPSATVPTVSIDPFGVTRRANEHPRSCNCDWCCEARYELRSAVSGSPPTGEHVSDVPASRDTPAAAGNSGGVPFTDVILDAVAEYHGTTRNAYYECAHGFAHLIGKPCTGECVP